MCVFLRIWRFKWQNKVMKFIQNFIVSALMSKLPLVVTDLYSSWDDVSKFKLKGQKCKSGSLLMVDGGTE